jgi:hypothetical protein
LNNWRHGVWVDAEADEMMKKMLKQGQEFLDRQKRQ